MMLSPEQLAALAPHPIAALFPMIEESDPEGFAALVESVADLGVATPLVLHDGLLLDGRNRRAALLAALERHGVAPDAPAVEWAELPVERRCGSPLEYVLTHNLARRHLSPSQRAIVAANVATWETGVNQHTAGSAHVPTQGEVASRFSISERALRAARRIRQNGPEELSTAIRDGRVSVRAASDLLRLDDRAIREAVLAPRRDTVAMARAIREENMAASRAMRLERAASITAAGAARAGALPAGPFGVLYADPAWRNEVWSEESGHDRSPERHYPTMALSDICALGVGAIAAPDAVLFLWRTGNRAEAAQAVAHAWGFRIVTELIWDKAAMGTGRWVRDCHEVLCICTRGSPLPPALGEAPPSIYREKRGEHSVKPVWFAQWICDLYPGVAKLELFQREASLGPDDPRREAANRWQFWGLEAGEKEAER